MKPYTQVGSLTSQTVKFFQETLQNWKESPEIHMEEMLCDFFPDVLSDYENLDSTQFTKAFQMHVFKTMVEACHIMLDTDETFLDASSNKMAAPLFTNGWWRKLLDMQEDMLLASFMLATASKKGSSYLKTSTINEISKWTGKTLHHDCTSQDIGTALFGEAWAALYVDEQDKSFEEVFDIISDSNPVFFYEKNNATQLELSNYLPEDLSR